MRMLHIFLMSLFFMSTCFFSAQAAAKGFEKDSRGRTLVYRSQPSWWSIPGGVALGGIGAYIVNDACYGGGDRTVKANTAFRLGEIFPDLHNILSNLRLKIPIRIGNAPTRIIEGAFGAAIAASGIGLLYNWLHNYSKLYSPLIIIDQAGLHYEGKESIHWKDVRSVTIVHGSTKKGYALEIVDLYDRFMIYESDIAITIDTLYDLIMHYYKSGSNKYIEKIKGIFNNVCQG